MFRKLSTNTLVYQHALLSHTKCSKIAFFGINLSTSETLQHSSVMSSLMICPRLWSEVHRRRPSLSSDSHAAAFSTAFANSVAKMNSNVLCSRRLIVLHARGTDVERHRTRPRCHTWQAVAAETVCAGGVCPQCQQVSGPLVTIWIPSVITENNAVWTSRVVQDSVKMWLEICYWFHCRYLLLS